MRYIFFFLSLLIFASAVHAVDLQINFTNINDSYVDPDNPGTNYGTATTLHVSVSQGTAIDERAYIRFNISSIPDNALLETVNLFFHGTFAASTYSHPIYEILSTDNWIETDINWTNQICGSSSSPNVSCNTTAITTINNTNVVSGIFNSSIISAVDDLSADSLEFVIWNAITASSSTTHSISSREYVTVTDRPKLYITYHTNAPEVRNITITPSIILENTTELNCSANYYSSVDNGRLNFTWYLNGQQQYNPGVSSLLNNGGLGWTNNTLKASDIGGSFSVGDIWSCHVQAWNTTDYSTTTILSYTVNSSAPTISLNYPTNTTYNGTEISINYTVADINENIDSCWYTLDTSYNNSLPSCNNISLGVGKGYHNLTLYINDTTGNNANSSTIFFTMNGNISTITTANATDNTSAIVSDSTTPTNNNSWVNFTVDWNDADGDTVSVFICKSDAFTTSCTGGTWVNDTLASDDPRSLRYDLTASESSSQYSWYAFIYDGIFASSSTSGTFDVNHPPSISTVTIDDTTPNVGNTINCINGSVTDTDSDTITFTYKWFKNSNVTAITTSNYSTVGHSSADQLVCEITPLDQHTYAGSSLNTSAAIVEVDVVGGGGSSGGGGTVVIVVNETSFKLSAKNLSLQASIGIPLTFSFDVTNTGDLDSEFTAQCVDGELCKYITFITPTKLIPKNVTKDIKFDVYIPSNTTPSNYTFTLTGNDAEFGLQYKLESTPYLGGAIFSILTSAVIIDENTPLLGNLITAIKNFLNSTSPFVPWEIPKYVLLILWLIPSAIVYSILRETRLKYIFTLLTWLGLTYLTFTVF